MAQHVLVVGAGGREHALIRQLAASPQRPRLSAAPGNPGTALLADNVALDPADQIGLVEWCRRRSPDLVVIGPEDPLIEGLGDRLREEGIPVFGPGAEGARLEGDKEFAKLVMRSAQVPTAEYACFTDRDDALARLRCIRYPVVVKACGAAQGKGVAVCADFAAAARHLDLCLVAGKFGDAGRRILLEECLSGPELSVLAVTDGDAYALLAPSRDHKRIGEGDSGPNTGGMGAFAPLDLTDHCNRQVAAEIIEPILEELRKRGIPYRGVLYAGLMLTNEGPKVLEFNCRFGDPETQVVLPLLAVDFLELLEAAAAGCLRAYLRDRPAGDPDVPQAWPGASLTDWGRHCVIVVGAARGYPGSYAKGEPLALPADQEGKAWMIHAGTRRSARGYETAGGRVLGAVGMASTLQQARREAYALMERVVCPNLVYRQDIASQAIAGESGKNG